MPEFICDVSQPTTPLPHVWEHTIGSGHAPLALRADWQRQLQRCHDELGIQDVRFHGMLSDDMGTLIRHAGELLYSFFNADQIVDFLRSIRMRPFVELSLMPAAIASGHETVFSYRGNVTPPKDYNQWGTLIRKLVRHWVDRYGIEEVRTWFFEVWNEPNITHFWTGTQDDYFTLYRHTVETIKGVDASLQVGGPATAQNEWIERFLDFCERNGLPADFVTTHYYPTDAFGKIGADTETQLANAPRDVMRQRAQEARAQAGDLPLYYTEWNVSSNPRDHRHDEPFAAAFVTKILMDVSEFVDGYSIWTFTDIFEENYFPSIPYHGGFGLLNLYGIPKPMYRAYELLHRIGTERFTVEGEHETLQAWVIRGDSRLTVLVVNVALPRHPIATEMVRVTLNNAPAPRIAYVERIDEIHANPRRLWEEMGAPTYLSPLQVDQLQAASHLTRESVSPHHENGAVYVDIEMPLQGTAAITLEFETGTLPVVNNQYPVVSSQ